MKVIHEDGNSGLLLGANTPLGRDGFGLIGSLGYNKDLHESCVSLCVCVCVWVCKVSVCVCVCVCVSSVCAFMEMFVSEFKGLFVFDPLME